MIEILSTVDACVTLVIPVKNEEASITRLIDSIREQSRQPDEVIVVDGGSTDGTVALVRDLTRDDPRFRVIEAGEATPGRGRNVGIAAASHELIALTDAGIRLEPRWLERLLAAAEADPEAEVVYGNYEPVAGTFFTDCAALAYVSPKRRKSSRLVRAPFIASSLISRDAWRAVGGFPDLRASEDLIFMERIRSRGFRIARAPSATVWWQLQPTLTQTFCKFCLYSKHNAWAGRQYDWHYGVARMYLLAGILVTLAVLNHPAWLGVAVLAGILRVTKRMWQRRHGRTVVQLLNPFRFLLVAIILVTVDLATLTGWFQASLRRRTLNPQPAK